MKGSRTSEKLFSFQELAREIAYSKQVKFQQSKTRGIILPTWKAADTTLAFMKGSQSSSVFRYFSYCIICYMQDI